jgi:hypothetical protein
MMVRLGGVKNNQSDEVTGDHDGRHREDEVKNEQLRFTAGLVLLGKEIHFGRDGIVPSLNLIGDGDTPSLP